MSVGPIPEHGRDILDFGLGERKLLRLPLQSVTRDPATGLITQSIESGVGTDGVSYTVTTNCTYTSGLLSKIARIYQGGGITSTETETILRDASGQVSSTTIARS